jgi:hypothetical protein
MPGVPSGLDRVYPINEAARRRPRTLAHDVVDSLAGRIRAGSLANGEKLPTEAAIMEEFGAEDRGEGDGFHRQVRLGADLGRAVARRKTQAKGPDLRRHAGQRFHLRHLATGRRHEPARFHDRPRHPL